MSELLAILVVAAVGFSVGSCIATTAAQRRYALALPALLAVSLPFAIEDFSDRLTLVYLLACAAGGALVQFLEQRPKSVEDVPQPSGSGTQSG